MLYRGFTVKLYPKKDQAILLDKHFGCARFIYNQMLVINQKKYHRTGKGLSGYDMQSYLPNLKKQHPWLSEVNSSSLQIVCHNLADAYNKFFKKKSKYPSFKKRNGRNSFTVIQNAYFSENYIRLPKLGKVKFRGGKCLSGVTKKFTIHKRAGKYYASALMEIDAPEFKQQSFTELTGIDLGLIDMVVTSGGDMFKANKFFKKSKKRLRVAAKRLSRAQKGSKRRNKARLSLSRIHEKISNQRKDSNHKITRILVNDAKNQGFGIENINIKGMVKNHKLASAISDVAWGQFITFLKYKSAAIGKQVIEVDRFYPSSKTCSCCGVVRQGLTLAIRSWTCEDCGAVHHRDINAAKNIALEAARNAVRGDGVSLVAKSASVCEASICS